MERDFSILGMANFFLKPPRTKAHSAGRRQGCSQHPRPDRERAVETPWWHLQPEVGRRSSLAARRLPPEPQSPLPDKGKDGAGHKGLVSCCLPTSRTLCSLWGALLLATPCLSSLPMSPAGSSPPPAVPAPPGTCDPGSWWQTGGGPGKNREKNCSIRKCTQQLK